MDTAIRLICTGILASILVVLANQDWKTREVSIVLLVLMPPAIMGMTYGTWILGSQFWSAYLFPQVALNLVFVSGLLCSIWVYVSLRNGSFVNPFRHYFGAGDTLFLVGCSFGFIPRNFILFVTVGAALALLGTMLFHRGKGRSTIPLVSYYSLTYLVLLLFEAARKLNSTIAWMS